MAVIQFPVAIPATNGNLPNMKFMVTTDNLAKLTTAGYLNAGNIDSAAPLSNNDIIMCLYSYNTQTQTGVFGIFTVAVTSATITLTEWVNTGDVLLPVAAGNIATFNNTSGQIKDSGIVATDVMLLDATNTLAATGKIIPAKVNGTEAANAVTASGMAGVITTSALTTAAGANYAITWTNTFITATSTVFVTISGGTNTVESVVFNVVPGAGSATLTIFNIGPTNPLNGTIKISYLVM